MSRSGTVVTAEWPAAVEAGQLLAALGFAVETADVPPFALRRGDTSVVAAPTMMDDDLARSGLSALTGHPDGPPLRPVGRPATVARAAALAYELCTGTPLDGIAALTQRSRLTRWTRAGRRSVGGGTRLLRAGDGWWALNLSRDADLVPALIERSVVHDAWADVEQWAAQRPVAEVIDRCVLLGLPASSLGETPPPESPWRIRQISVGHDRGRTRPLVVNFGALWAAPLAALLLQRAGADVVHVESTSRPDPSRVSTPNVYAALRSGGTVRRVDFDDTDALRRLVERADVVIEASRARAFRSLGIDAEQVMQDGHRRVWLRLTGHADPQRVAFGDDAAVAGGLVAYDDAWCPVFAGDAIADPLSGLLGAVAIAACWKQGSWLIEQNLAGVAAYCAQPAAALADST